MRMMRPTRVLEFFVWRRWLVVCFFGVTGCVVNRVSDEVVEREVIGQKDEVAVLFIGNSYSFGVPGALEELAEGRGRRVRTGHSTYGGWSLAQHRGHGPTLEKLRGGGWDVVVLQEYSLTPAQGERVRRRRMEPAVRFFVGEIRKVGAVPLLYQTWGRRDGAPGVRGDDFYKMNERVRQGYREAADAAGGVGVVAVGDAWEEEFAAGRGWDLFEEDGSHPSGYGDEVTARAFYEFIFSM